MSPLLEIRDLTQMFGRLKALDRVTFDLNEGEIVALIGPNGAGKTTFVNAITGAFRNWTGTVTFKGRSLSNCRQHQIARMGIARTYQVVEPFAEMSALENVMVGALHGTDGHASMKAAREKAERILERLGLADLGHLRGERLNVPERKRLEIARALVSNPQILMLDEIMAGLTGREVDEMVEIVQTIRSEGVTVLLIEHVMQAVANLSDRIVVLHHGEMVAEGTPEDVFAHEDVISAYLGSRSVTRRRAKEAD